MCCGLNFYWQVIVPPDGYLKAVRDLCSKYNVLMIADEIQSGLGRSGRLLACDWEEVHADIVVRIMFDIYLFNVSTIYLKDNFLHQAISIQNFPSMLLLLYGL